METPPGLHSQDCLSFNRLFPPHPLVWAVDLTPCCTVPRRWVPGPGSVPRWHGSVTRLPRAPQPPPQPAREPPRSSHPRAAAQASPVPSSRRGREPSSALTCFTAPPCPKHGLPPSPSFNTDFHGLILMRTRSANRVTGISPCPATPTGLVRASGFGHAAPQTRSGLLRPARTPCPLLLPWLSGPLCPAPSPGVTDAELLSAAADTAAPRTQENLSDLLHLTLAADRSLPVSGVPPSTETGVLLQEQVC